MAIPDLSVQNLAYHQAKLDALKPGSQRLWGEMTVERMLWHLRRTIDMTMEEPNGKQKAIAPPIIRDIVGFLFFDAMTTWPKGKLKATPNLLSDDVGPFEEEKRKLLESCAAFAKRLEANPNEPRFHPLTGKSNLKRIAHLHGVHMNHHYRQFGVV